MRLISRNIQGYKNRDTGLLVGAMKLIARLQPDMLFLQEVLSTGDDNNKSDPKNVLRDFWGGYTHVYTPVFVYNHDYGKGVRSSENIWEGLLVFSKHPISVEAITLPVITGTDRRPRSAQIITYENNTIVHTHLSKYEESRRLQCESINTIGTDILVGDCNMPPDEVKASFPEYTSSFGFCDYVSFPEKNSTLDYVCLGDTYEFEAVEVDFMKGISDHACLMVDVRRK